jgi:eukaryotic-like serine/threonine-protein kinase
MMIGTKLAHFEITSHLGLGGMGDVYQATDAKLGRSVAIKFLPEAFSHDTERVARFQREARVLASLNHSNIAAIHGLEEIDSRHFLVMELVSGETLAERIKRGAIPIEEALPIAKQIAEGLEEAHEKGIIHRDLKPANIKITPDGKVKVLDFGLAKAYERESSDASVSNSPTISMAATNAGVILGTAAYMSPEQARGKAVTRATDIFAFGAVLYELLTGKQAFQGEDAGDILASVVKTEPDWSLLPHSTPPGIRTMLQRCMRKDPRQRLRDATGIRIEIEEALANPYTPAAAAPAAALQRGIPLRTVIPAAVALLIFGVALGWIFRPAPRAASRNPLRVQIALPSGDRLSDQNVSVALSAEGMRLAYIGISGGVQQLYVRALDSLEARAISGTEGATNPFFSPDGQWIGFFSQGKMQKAPVSGGAPAVICDAGANGGASWGPDGRIVFSPSGLGLSLVSAAGGEPKALTTPDQTKGEYSHRYPQFMPDGKSILFTALNGFGWDESRVEVLQLDTMERRVLIRGGHTGRFLPPGRLLYYRGGSLMAVPFDPARLEVQGSTPVTLVDGVLQSSGTIGAAYTISATGTLAYISAPGGSRQFDRRLVWVSRQGEIQPLAAPVRAYGTSFDLSPDGQKIAVTIRSGTDELWIYDEPRGSLTRLSSDMGSSFSPVWSPDGRRVVYRSNKAGIWNLYWRAADGSGADEKLTQEKFSQVPWSWLPDGKTLAFWSFDATGSDIWILPVDGDRKPQRFMATRFNELDPRFSPDGRWLAYTSDESGGDQVYVQRYPGPGRRWQVSTDGGNEPQWNRNGHELFYRNGDRTMVVDVTLSPDFSAGKPRVLYTGPAGKVSPDGRRFLAIQSVEPEQPPTQVNLVLNEE